VGGGGGRGGLYFSVALRMIINCPYRLEKRLGGTHCASLDIRTGERNLFTLPEISPRSVGHTAQSLETSRFVDVLRHTARFQGTSPEHG
jgi:hypothetical protein